MVHLEMPHVNVLTKCDLLEGKKGLEAFLDMDIGGLESMLDAEINSTKLKDFNEFTFPNSIPPVLTSSFSSSSTSPNDNTFLRLNKMMCSVIEDFNLVSFIPLDITDEDSIERLLVAVDTALQFGEGKILSIF
jgi:hypothetical protein